MDDSRPTALQNIGAAILVLTVGIPALERAGFTVLLGTRFGWDLPTYLAVAMFGGALGAALLAREHFVAGFIGGMVAGPSGFLAVYVYAHDQEIVHTWGCVAVQFVGSLPGLAVFHLLKGLLSSEHARIEPKSYAARNTDEG